MLKTLVQIMLPPVAVLVLLGPGRTIAAPPDKVSLKIVPVPATDDVAEGLKKYRKEDDLGKKMVLLRQLATSRDPRVAVALGEALDDVRLCQLPVWTCGGGRGRFRAW